MIGNRALEAIEAADTDELLRVVDGYVAADSWDELLELRARCREAVARGKQVWGVEEHIRYRLALEGPPRLAGSVVSEGEARFALGPLPEVAASTKTWVELEPHLAPGPERSTTAAERVVRGEIVEEPIPDLPSRLEQWEPPYQVATYHRDRVEAPPPPLPDLGWFRGPAPAAALDDLPSTEALADLVQPWTDESNGRCLTTAVEGDQVGAIASLGLQEGRVGQLEPGRGLAWMAWAAASGGAHGRRRGAAAGRYLAWWAVSVLADLDWPGAPDALGEAVRRMHFYWFDDGSPDTGWVLRLAITSPESGLSWAISAADQV